MGRWLVARTLRMRKRELRMRVAGVSNPCPVIAARVENPCYRNPSWFHQLIPNEDAIVLDPAADVTGALTRNIFETRDGARLTEIQHQPMRMRRLGIAPLRVPEVGGLPVDGVLSRSIFSRALFAVDVS